MKAILFSALVALSVGACKKTQALDVQDPASGGMPAMAMPAEESAPDTVMMSPPPMPETAKPIPSDGKYPMMSFERTEHDFGKINAGDKVTYTFNFTNTGAADLVISNAVGSCGCTVPEYPKEPVKPGASGKIKVTFNSTGKSGNQQKTVTISTNTQAGKELLTIKAMINPKA